MEIIKKGQLRKWLKFVFLGALMTGAFLMISSVVFANAVTSITLQDTDHNGELDHVVLVFDGNVQLEDVTDIVPDANKADFHVTDSANAGAAVTVTALVEAPAGTITLTLDETTVTANNTGNILEVYYTDPITDQVIEYASDTEDIAINTGDGGAPAIAEADGANPILISATWAKSGGKNTLALVYSEALYVSMDEGGDQDITTGGTTYAASTATLGAMTTAKTLEGIVTWDGSSDFTCNSTTTNKVAMSNSDKIITITFNNTTGSFYSAGTTAPAGTDTVTPVADANDITDTNNNAVSAIPTVTATLTSFDSTVSTAIPAGFEKGGINGSGYDYYNWATIANPLSDDFGTYLILFSTTENNVTNKTFTSTTEWTAAEDSALATRTTATTVVTSITGSNATYVAIVSVDSYGNVSGISNILTVTPQQSSGTKPDTTGPDAPTGFNISINDSLKVMLTWTDPIASDLDAVRILKSETGSNYFMVGTVNKGVKTYTDNSVEEGDKAYYKLVGVDKKGNAGTETNVLNIEVKKAAVIEVENAVEGIDNATEEEGDTGGEETLVVEPAVITTESGTTATFTDIQGTWAAAPIEAMIEKGIMTGQKEGIFNPAGTLNRAEASRMLFNVLGLSEPQAPTETLFKDVDNTTWYAGYVYDLNKLGLINGKTIDTFVPGAEMNRAEFMTLAMHVYHFVTQTTQPETQTVTPVLIDMLDTAYYALPASEAYEKGFIAGYDIESKRYFKPSKIITRAEAAAILYNMFYDILSE